MRTVTGCTGWGAWVLLLQERNTVHALFVKVVLVGWNIIGLHQLCVCMTTAAQPRNVHRIYIRSRVLDLFCAVSIMADKAGGYIHVALGEFCAVDTRLVLGVLIGRDVVLAHQVHPRVTARAERRDILGLGCIDKARGLGHGLFFGLFRRVAAVAIHALDPAGRVDARRMLFHNVGALATLRSMALDARILVCCRRGVWNASRNDHGSHYFGLVARFALVIRAPCVTRRHFGCPANPGLVT